MIIDIIILPRFNCFFSANSSRGALKTTRFSTFDHERPIKATAIVLTVAIGPWPWTLTMDHGPSKILSMDVHTWKISMVHGPWSSHDQVLTMDLGHWPWTMDLDLGPWPMDHGP